MSNLAEFAITFESLAEENGEVTWQEDDLMRELGYASTTAFRKVLYRAMQVCLSLNADPAKYFISVGTKYKLNRVACYLVAMSANPRKPKVATVQAYLAQFADDVHDCYSHSAMVDRVFLREEMKEGMKALTSTAHRHGVTNYGAFLDEGYRGMYNMRLKDLERLKGLGSSEHLIDRMDRTELAANNFRVTLTDGRIKKDNVRGQEALEAAAFDVGRIVRDAVIEAGSPPPEQLPLAEHIKKTKKTLQTASHRLKQLQRKDVDDEIEYLAAVSPFRSEPAYTADPDEEPAPESDTPF